MHPDQNALFQEAKKELKGKIIACWCSPLNCHGHVLAEIANSTPPNSWASTIQSSQPVIAPKSTNIFKSVDTFKKPNFESEDDFPVMMRKK
eukprot:gene3471-3950_t